MRNLLAYADLQGHGVVATSSAPPSSRKMPPVPATNGARWPKSAKLAAMMDDMEGDVLAYMGFPQAHRIKLHSTNPIERLDGEIERRADVVGIFPNEAAIRRLFGAILLEQNDEWAIKRGRYMKLETMAGLSDDPIVKLPAEAA